MKVERAGCILFDTVKDAGLKLRKYQLLMIYFYHDK